ncbi:hypothetical protein IFM12275_24630 [Nocardia sputorum]|uniref:hypothetical protein n=1 Tax=Nocardia sputorum TaxID=2984338 RepID=UPI00248FAF88|nr:hypothetical protein [Nocardia sputorum]BDT92487.1 hypothetical protein IFM12275_24630 [Nocardia sputorum]
MTVRAQHDQIGDGVFDSLSDVQRVDVVNLGVPGTVFWIDPFEVDGSSHCHWELAAMVWDGMSEAFRT